MKLYHCSNARSVRPLWTLEELGVNYDLFNALQTDNARLRGVLTGKESDVETLDD